MTNPDITQEKVDQLLEDAGFLQDEAEALKYVIDTIPYEKDVPEKRSVKDNLMLLDYIQVYYYRKIVEELLKNKNIVRATGYEEFCNSFDPDTDKDIFKILEKISAHRAALINTLKNLSIFDWEKPVLIEGRGKITLFEYIKGMISNDRKVLKEIADLVMVFQNDRQVQRELDRKESQSD